MSETFKIYYNHEEETYYSIDDPLCNWEHQGIECPVCGFEGGLFHKESCWDCEGPLVDCPRCIRITCLGTEPYLGDLR